VKPHSTGEVTHPIPFGFRLARFEFVKLPTGMAFTIQNPGRYLRSQETDGLLAIGKTSDPRAPKSKIQNGITLAFWQNLKTPIQVALPALLDSL